MDANFEQDILYRNVKPTLTMFIIWNFHMHTDTMGYLLNMGSKEKLGK